MVRVPMAAGPNPVGTWRLLKTARNERADVLHAHGYKADILLGCLPRWSRPPLVATIHGHTHTRGASRLAVYEWLDRRALGRADRVMLVHEQMRAHYGASLADAQWIVIENGIALDVDLQNGPEPALADFCRRQPTIGAVGRLVPEKGLFLLVDAFAALVGQNRDLGLVLVGDGPDRGRLQERVRALGLSERVVLTGFVSNVPAVLPLFVLLALPSFTEGLPLTVLEAMRTGLPVVATRVGGVPAVLGNDVAGVLVEPNDTAGLTEALGRLVDDHELRRALGAAGRRRLIERFSSAAMADRYEALYHEVLAHSSRQD